MKLPFRNFYQCTSTSPRIVPNILPSILVCRTLKYFLQIEQKISKCTENMRTLNSMFRAISSWIDEMMWKKKHGRKIVGKLFIRFALDAKFN